MSPETILILGGTSEARALAGELAGLGRYRVITSLAGRTADPAALKGEVRIGGFGGVDGLIRYIDEEKIGLVVDATHPFAAGMSANAAEASRKTGTPCFRLERPAWRPLPGDDWREVADTAEAARAIPAGARALVTVGRQEVAPFLARSDIHVVARMIERPETDLPPNAELVLARPPYPLPDERALLADRAIDILVAKNAGGTATVAKLMAARDRGIPVIMVARPYKPTLPTVPDVAAALETITGEAGD